MKLTVGSICSGIGGWDLGLERAGMVTRWQVELDPWCRRVLARHFPHAERYEDAHAVDYTEVGYVDVIAAGYPCQPFSVAGLRRGSDDPRNVWPAVARAVRDIRPRFVCLENVAGHLSMGFGSVLGDLASLGYDARWEVLPAAAFGAPHLRERVWIIAALAHAADSDSAGRKKQHPTTQLNRQRQLGRSADARSPADSDSVRCHRLSQCDSKEARGVGFQRRHNPDRLGMDDNHRRDDAGPMPFRADSAWLVGPSQPWVRRVDDGVSRGLDRRRLKALGNALVPQIAEYIGRQVVRMSEAAA